MHELSLHPAYRTQRFRALSSAFPTHENQLEAEQVVFSHWYMAHRRKEWWSWCLRLWPIAVGVAISIFAPEIHAWLVRSHPWGMWVVFPYALLAHRPEVAINAQLSRFLPTAALLLQFPIEGLLARMILRRRVTVSGVTGQILYFHYLAALQLILLTGVAAQILAL
jgi:hypothetical protein